MITGRDAERLAHLGKSSQRIVAVRQRKRRQLRWFWLAIFGGIGFVVASFWVRDSSPEPPGLVVRWPKPKLSQRVSPGSTLLLRRGSAFVVSTTEPDKWDVFFTAGASQGRADSRGEWRWLPSGDRDTLTVRCRARTDGWRRAASWFWPQPELKLSALAAQAAGNFRLRVEPPSGGMWVYPFTYLKTAVTWDEQAMQLLSEPLVPALAGNLELSSPATMPEQAAATLAGTVEQSRTSSGPDQPLWTLVPSFSSDEPSRADTGTYAKLNSTQPERDMAHVANFIATKKPDLSLRYVVRLDTKPPGAILRVALDGKGDRKAWVRRPGESSGGPIVWPTTETASIGLAGQ